jgi:2-C-methyl-D-erythritol 2,4-cyclodiphosphate synthase
MRVGIGIDFHRFDADRPLILGGVTVPYDRGLLGHSDADVLAHAVCDALLGAAGLEDIGVHFPDSDPQYRGVSSLRLLEKVVALLAEDQYRPANIDCVVIAQEPRLAAHFPAMKQALSLILGLPHGQIGLKATTSEHMGMIGQGEGIAALVVCLIEKV